MIKFNLGDTVYCIQNGLGKVVSPDGTLRSRGLGHVYVQFKSYTRVYYDDGKATFNSVNPILLTLEEARAKGYDIPKTKVKKTVNYYLNISSTGHHEIYSKKDEALIRARRNSLVTGVELTGEYEIEE